MTKIKICGIRRIEDIEYVNEYKPDFIGFVFAESKRRITYEQAKEFRKHLDDKIEVVGVFVDENEQVIAKYLNDGIIDNVQLHGTEDEEYIKYLRSLIKSGKIIKAVRVADKSDVIDSLSCSADYVLYDTYKAGVAGGTGQTFDWDLLKEVNRHFFLAGGIGVNNITEAIDKLNPYAIDLSSALEVNGYKDKQKISEIIEKVRRYANALETED